MLVPHGHLLLWDVILPARFDPVKDIAVFPLRIRLPHREVSTGYGTYFPTLIHDVPYFTALARRTGFDVVTERAAGHTFFLELQKTAAPPSVDP